jgi:hypothetical protein
MRSCVSAIGIASIEDAALDMVCRLHLANFTFVGVEMKKLLRELETKENRIMYSKQSQRW